MKKEVVKRLPLAVWPTPTLTPTGMKRLKPLMPWTCPKNSFVVFTRTVSRNHLPFSSVLFVLPWWDVTWLLRRSLERYVSGFFPFSCTFVGDDFIVRVLAAGARDDESTNNTIFRVWIESPSMCLRNLTWKLTLRTRWCHVVVASSRLLLFLVCHFISQSRFLCSFFSSIPTG